MSFSKYIRPTRHQIHKFKECLNLPIVPYPIHEAVNPGERRWFPIDNENKSLLCAIDGGTFDFRMRQYHANNMTMRPRHYIYCRDIDHKINYYFAYDNDDGTNLAIMVSDEKGCSPDSIKEVIDIIRAEFG